MVELTDLAKQGHFPLPEKPVDGSYPCAPQKKDGAEAIANDC